MSEDIPQGSVLLEDKLLTFQTRPIIYDNVLVCYLRLSVIPFIIITMYVSSNAVKESSNSRLKGWRWLVRLNSCIPSVPIVGQRGPAPAPVGPRAGAELIAPQPLSPRLSLTHDGLHSMNYSPCHCHRAGSEHAGCMDSSEHSQHQRTHVSHGHFVALLSFFDVLSLC